MSDFVPLSGEEYEAVKKTVEEILSVPTVPCTACRYCVDGCPQQIHIPDLFQCLNKVKLYGENQQASNGYKEHSEAGNPASECIHCGQCEEVCPQHLSVMEFLEEAAAVFEKNV